MNVELNLAKESFNTKYAPLAVLFNHYQHNEILKPLELVNVSMKNIDFSSVDKLKQTLLSIMCGCDTFSAINTSLKDEFFLAKSWVFSCKGQKSLIGFWAIHCLIPSLMLRKFLIVPDNKKFIFVSFFTSISN